MKKCISTIIFLIVALCGIYAQNITIKFTGRSQDNAYMRLDSIVVHNYSQNWERTIIYPDTTMTAILNGIYEHKNADFSLSQNTPNPFDGKTEVELTNPEYGHITLLINDISGKLIAQFSTDLSAGTHKFNINIETPQTYILSANTNGKTSSIKMINTGKGGSNSISYLGQNLQHKLIINDMFELGDVMKYTGYATFEGVSVSSTPVVQMQNGNEDITLAFPVNIIGEEELPQVSTLEATGISQTSATMNGRVSLNCPVQTTGFYYGTSTNSMTNNITTTQSPTGSFSYLLSGLEQGTTYFYRAYAIYNNETYNGEIKSFTTDSPNGNHDITVTFTSQGHSTNYQWLYMYIPLDSVKVVNQTRNWEQTLIFPDTIMNVDLVNAKLNINGNASYGDRMTYTGYTTYRGIVYYRQIQANLNSGTWQFLFGIPFCDDFYMHIELSDCVPITYNGITYTQSGHYEIGHYQTSYNCDSLIILDIDIRNHIFNEIVVQTCDESYTWDGITYTESGIYQRTYTSVNGCDSLVSLVLTVGNGFTDERDGNSYCTITIGNQVWMAENLRYLPSVYRSSQESNTESRYYVYDYQGNNVEEAKSTYNYNEYGVLYNNIAAQNACPAGWHLPSDSEWTELEIYLENNGYNFDGYIDSDNDRETHNVIAKSMASKSNWTVSDINNSPGCLQQKNNSSGFNGKPAGWKHLNGLFKHINESAAWWATGYYENGNGWDRYLFFSRTYCNRSHNNKHIGLSIRCIQD